MPLLRLFFFLIFTASAAQAITLERPLENSAQEARAKALFHEIRCMVCSGESIADSRAKLALDLRHFVRTHIDDGKTDKEIIASLQASYGDEILMRPPLQENTLPLWIAPFMLIAIGGFAVWRFLRTSTEPNRRPNITKD